MINSFGKCLNRQSEIEDFIGSDKESQLASLQDSLATEVAIKMWFSGFVVVILILE